MANKNAAANGVKTRFKAGKEQAIISAIGAKKSVEVRKAQKEALDVFRGAVDNTTQKDLMEAFMTIQRFAKRGSLPHWQEWLRLIGQSGLQDGSEGTGGVVLMPKRGDHE